MKKTLCILTGILIMLLSAVTVSADFTSKFFDIYTKDGEAKHTHTTIGAYFYGDDTIQLDTEPQSEVPAENLFSVCSDYEYMLTYDFKTTNTENPYHFGVHFIFFVLSV